MKKLLVIILAVCMMLSAAACGSGSGGTESQATEVSGEKTVNAEKTELTWCVNAAEAGSYNGWRTGSTMANVPVLGAIMESLIKNIGGEWIYVLCTSYELESDNTVLVHLRDNVYFHNGEKMTAEDVVYSADLSINGVGGAAIFSMIKSVEAVDDLTVRINLNFQSSGFNNALANIKVTSKKYFEEAGHEGFALHPVGTGYYMWDQYTAGDSITLKAFDKYWGEHGTIKTLRFRFIQETSQALIELENHNVDIIYADGSTLRTIEGNDELKVVTVNDLIVEYLGFNMNSEKMKDERVRQAIAHAIDREAINIGARESLCEVTDTFLLPSHGDKYNPDAANFYEYDTDKAKQLMNEAGYSESNPLTLKLMTDTQKQRTLEAQQIKSMLDDVCFNVEIQSFEAAAFNDVLMGGDPEWYDMMIRGVGVSYGEPLQQIYTICSPDGTRAKTNPMWLTEESSPKAKEFNDKLLEALSKMDPAEQLPLVHELQILDREVLENVWLFNRVSYYAVSSDLEISPDSTALNTMTAYFSK